MDFPAWEVLTSLSEKGNLVAKMFLTRWDSIFTKDDEPKAKDGGNDHIFNDDAWTGFMTRVSGNPIQSTEPLPQIPGWDYWRDRDLRIKRLILSGYRGIPADSEKYYGLTFTGPQDNNIDIETCGEEPESYIIVGSNGSGKTTLYSAMELALINQTAIESKHKIKTTERQNAFRHHFGAVSNPLFIQVTLADNGIIPRIAVNHPIYKHECSIKEHIDLSPFFCSESDLSIIECDGIGMKEYLDNAIGLGELNKIEARLEEIRTSMVEKTEKKALNGHTKASLTEDDIKALEKFATYSEELKEAIENKISEIRLDLLPQAQHIISTLLKDYESDEVELSFDSENGKKMFNGMLQLKNDKSQKIRPRYYFNNFRFKLYLVSLKIAIAFYIMKSRKISFPLVFDDIFDSSDFTNRLNSKNFFNNIFKEYHDLEINNNPLQLIFFTQDDIIAESIYDGVCDLRRETDPFCDKNNYPPRKVNLVQIFSPSEINEKEDGNRISISSGDKTGNMELIFYNLYDRVKFNTDFNDAVKKN